MLFLQQISRPIQDDTSKGVFIDQLHGSEAGAGVLLTKPGELGKVGLTFSTRYPFSAGDPSGKMNQGQTRPLQVCQHARYSVLLKLLTRASGSIVSTRIGSNICSASGRARTHL